MLMFTIGCEDEEVADNDSETMLWRHLQSLFLKVVLKNMQVRVVYLILKVRNSNDIKTQIGTDLDLETPQHY